MLLKCVELDCATEIVQDDVKFSKNAPQRFAEQICLWYPELSNIVITLLYYKMCCFATYQNENRIKARMDLFAEKVASCGIAGDALPSALRRSSCTGYRSSDEAWEFITSHRNLCMENTRLICETVDNAVEVLEGILAAGGKGKARARSSLRVMRLYGVPTSQDPLERNELKYVVRCTQYIKQLVGEKFDAVFARVMGMEHNQQTIAEHMYFHHTEFLLEYYKCIMTRRYETNRSGVRLRGGAGVPADAEPYAIELVQSALESLKELEPDGDLLYKTVLLLYCSDVPIHEADKSEWGNSINQVYNRRNRALQVLSILLWGYATTDIMDLLANIKKAPSSKKSRKNAAQPELLNFNIQAQPAL